VNASSSESKNRVSSVESADRYAALSEQQPEPQRAGSAGSLIGTAVGGLGLLDLSLLREVVSVPVVRISRLIRTHCLSRV
jgi:hypothetical protein